MLSFVHVFVISQFIQSMIIAELKSSITFLHRAFPGHFWDTLCAYDFCPWFIIVRYKKSPWKFDRTTCRHHYRRTTQCRGNANDSDIESTYLIRKSVHLLLVTNEMSCWKCRYGRLRVWIYSCISNIFYSDDWACNHIRGSLTPMKAVWIEGGQRSNHFIMSYLSNFDPFIFPC